MSRGERENRAQLRTPSCKRCIRRHYDFVIGAAKLRIEELQKSRITENRVLQRCGCKGYDCGPLERFLPIVIRNWIGAYRHWRGVDRPIRLTCRS